MAAVLEQISPIAPKMSAIYGAEAASVAALERRKLLRDPRIWGIETARLLFYVLARVIAVPWLLVWPAVIFWVLWVSMSFDAAQVSQSLHGSLGPQIGWAYVLGAAFHSLTFIGCRPYESEVERRLEAYMMHWQARRAWLERHGRRPLENRQ